jgi:hypothetical protein
VPTCFWPSRSDSFAARFRMRFDSTLSGTSNGRAEPLTALDLGFDFLSEGLHSAFLVEELLSEPAILAE